MSSQMALLDAVARRFGDKALTPPVDFVEQN